jgi:superfamily I DNA/RNA helicase
MYAQQVGILRSKGWSSTSEAAQAAIQALQGEKDRSGLYMGPFPALQDAWRLYERAKHGLDAYDFEDALYAYWQRGTDGAGLVIVDEAQDNSWLQLDLARKLAQRGRGKLILVGDVRQAIYEFRGADPEIMQHADVTLNAATLEIPTNYRSGWQIVDVGNLVCENEPWSVGSPALASRKDPDGTTPSGLVRIRGSGTLMEEARDTMREIRRLLDVSVPPSECAVLTRTNAETGPYEIAAILEKIPVLVLGARGSFFDRGLVKDITSLLLLAGKFGPSSKEDRVDAIMRRDVSTRLDPESRARRFKYMNRNLLEEILTRAVSSPDVATGLLQARASTALQDGRGGRNAHKWKADLQDLSREIEAIANAPWPDCVKTAAVVLAPDLEDELAGTAGEEPEDDEEKENDDAQKETAEDEEGGDTSVLTAFIEVAAQFDTPEDLRGFAEQMASWIKAISNPGNMSPEKFQEEAASRIVISTCHKCKGLEFKHVWVSSSKGVFPHRRAASEKDLAGEQRLFYVAVTRGRDSVTVTYADRGPTPKTGGPSSFVQDYVEPYAERIRRGVPRWADVEAALRDEAPKPWRLLGTRATTEELPVTYTWEHADSGQVVSVQEALTTERSLWVVLQGGRGTAPEAPAHDTFQQALSAAQRFMATGTLDIPAAPVFSGETVAELLQLPANWPERWRWAQIPEGYPEPWAGRWRSAPMPLEAVPSQGPDSLSRAIDDAITHLEVQLGPVKGSQWVPLEVRYDGDSAPDRFELRTVGGQPRVRQPRQDGDGWVVFRKTGDGRWGPDGYRYPQGSSSMGDHFWGQPIAGENLPAENDIPAFLAWARTLPGFAIGRLSWPEFLDQVLAQELDIARAIEKAEENT